MLPLVVNTILPSGSCRIYLIWLSLNPCEVLMEVNRKSLAYSGNIILIYKQISRLICFFLMISHNLPIFSKAGILPLRKV